ncbi:MAG: hypothetical protein IJ781_13205 [Atopobiaceae bacterium]|nr:hypothetical protein [Atopobiaceae bacterium]
MRLVWIVIGAGMLATCVVSLWLDAKGSEDAAATAALAFFALGLAACVLYGWEYRPLAPDAPPACEVPVVYDRRLDPQPLETMD